MSPNFWKTLCISNLESATFDIDTHVLVAFEPHNTPTTFAANPSPPSGYLNMTKYTSPTKKARIVRYKAGGMSDTDIAKKFRLHRTTITRINDRYAKSEDYYNIKHKSGRPRKFTTQDARYAVQMLASTDSHDIANLQRKYFPDINAETIRTRLQACGLNGRVCHKKPLLTKAHKQKRLEWAQAHAHWSVEDWMTVIFSDESKFNLIGSDGRSWCWRRPGEEFDQRYTKKVVKHGGGNVMVWGCVYNSRRLGSDLPDRGQHGRIPIRGNS